MIKLIRNAFKKGDIINKNGNTINWKFIAELVNLQEFEELHAANKITQSM